jgi:hypothetical protein
MGGQLVGVLGIKLTIITLLIVIGILSLFLLLLLPLFVLVFGLFYLAHFTCLYFEDPAFGELLEVLQKGVIKLDEIL